MDKSIIEANIIRFEEHLLRLSESVHAINGVDNMSEWIVEVITNHPVLAKALNFPTNQKVSSALLTLLQTNSSLTEPLERLLSLRIATFIATIDDLYHHTYRGATLNPLMRNFDNLVRLTEPYSAGYDRPKTINLIADAIRENKMYTYKAGPKESDLRIALRAFYEDDERADQMSIKILWDFILEEMMKEVRQGRYLSQSRHSWWALLTLLEEGKEEWLSVNSKSIEAITFFLVQRIDTVISAPADPNFSSIVEELDSPFNQLAWVLANAMRCLDKNLGRYISQELVDLLRKKIEMNLAVMLNRYKNEDSLKSIQSRLICLYDAIRYFNTKDCIHICRSGSFDLRDRRIGRFFYEEKTVHKCRDMLSRIDDFRVNRKKYTKVTLTTALVSGKAGQGKSELAKQLIAELRVKSAADGYSISEYYFNIGKDIKTADHLESTLKNLAEDKSGSAIRIVVFDEFDKSKFEFYTPFLSFLESDVPDDAPITVYLFAQSTYPTKALFDRGAEITNNIAMRDFITRIRLGALDLHDINTNVIQRICALIGLSQKALGPFTQISSELLMFYGDGKMYKDSRELNEDLSQNAIVVDNVLKLNEKARKHNHADVIGLPDKITLIL